MLLDINFLELVNFLVALLQAVVMFIEGQMMMMP